MHHLEATGHDFGVGSQPVVTEDLACVQLNGTISDLLLEETRAVFQYPYFLEYTQP